MLGFLKYRRARTQRSNFVFFFAKCFVERKKAPYAQSKEKHRFFLYHKRKAHLQLFQNKRIFLSHPPTVAPAPPGRGNRIGSNPGAFEKSSGANELSNPPRTVAVASTTVDGDGVGTSATAGKGGIHNQICARTRSRWGWHSRS